MIRRRARVALFVLVVLSFAGLASAQEANTVLGSVNRRQIQAVTDVTLPTVITAAMLPTGDEWLIVRGDVTNADKQNPSFRVAFSLFVVNPLTGANYFVQGGTFVGNDSTDPIFFALPANSPSFPGGLVGKQVRLRLDPFTERVSVGGSIELGLTFPTE